MICPPCLLRIVIEDEERRTLNLWVPLILFWLPLVLLGLALAPLMLLLALCCRGTGWGRLLLLAGPRLYELGCALGGLKVHVGNRTGRRILILFW